jgi:hypothetical protein
VAQKFPRWLMVMDTYPVTVEETDNPDVGRLEREDEAI